MVVEQVDELVDAARSRDREAFGRLVERFSATVTGVAYSLLGDFSLSEDVGQETFLDAWRKLPDLEHSEKFLPWVCTIARRKSIDIMRKNKGPRLSAMLEESIDSRPSHESILEQSQERELVWEYMGALPETYRETMVLYYRGEQSIEVVASALDTPAATIRQRLKRGRDLLREEVLNSLAGTLRKTAPGAAFTAAVVAALGTGGKASAATASTVASYVALKGGSSVGASAASKSAVAAHAGAASLSAAFLGPLIGLAGGFLGTWCSWKNASYASERRFIVREAITYVVVMAFFLTLGAALLYGNRIGWITGPVQAGLLVLLLVLFQIWNGWWIIHVIRSNKRTRDDARVNDEPLLPNAPERDRNESAARNFTQESSLWHKGWIGGVIGGTSWMLISASILFANDHLVPSAIVAVCFIVGVSTGITLWSFRTSLRHDSAIQVYLGILFLLTAICFVSFQFFSDRNAQTLLSWNPLCFLLLILFPALSLRFSNQR